MYDDLLGERKPKEVKAAPNPDLEVGTCFQCKFAKRSKVHRRSENLYCTEIKKYIHKRQQSCLRFRRRVYDVKVAKS